MREFARHGTAVGRGRIGILDRQDSMSTQDSWAADRAAARLDRHAGATPSRHVSRAARTPHRYRLPGHGNTAALSAATVAALAALWWVA
ncbi:binding-protein-dependent transport systems inner membrane component, partial [Burkholderia sp. TJI49]